MLAPLSNSLEISSGLKILADKSLTDISPYGVLVRKGLLHKIGMVMINRRKQAQALSDLADIPEVDSRKWHFLVPLFMLDLRLVFKNISY